MSSERHPFLWGAATSSHQVEGGNVHNDWWEWEEKGGIEGGVRSGAATDHINRFREDLKLAKDMGLNAYRFSIEWSRLEPEEGRWNDEAMQWYANLISECESLGLMPMATLHHFTCPQWFAKQGGFTATDSPEKFERYVRRVVKALGARVPMWCTINEPVVYVIGAYLGKFMPPAIVSPEKASIAFANLLRSHALAYDILHGEIRVRQGPWASQPLMVGYAHNMLSFRPASRFHPMEVAIAAGLDRVYNFAWISATLGKGRRFWLPGVIPRAPVVEELRGRRTTDFIGVNYYTRAYVQWRPRTKDSNQVESIPVGISFARRREKVSDLEWSIDPRGFGRLLRRVAEFKLPIYVTENGIADRDDFRRPKYLVDHLAEVGSAIEDGADIRGYFHWSLIDNFEWIKGFWPRFGLHSVDYTTLARKKTRSAELYQEIIRQHAGGAPDWRALRDFARDEDLR
jgi:beta-glucosidase